MKTTYSIVLLTLLCFAGCTSQKLPDGMPKLYPVTMTVTQEGKPLADASVMLANAAKVLGINVDGFAQTAYDDQGDIRSWARLQINFLSHYGIMGNTSSVAGVNTFSPGNAYQMQQGVLTFYRLLNGFLDGEFEMNEPVPDAYDV